MRRNERGFTLMELMVVIVIVAILAAVAVPLYTNYVRDAQRTEARGAIGAVITAEQAFYQKSAATPGGTPKFGTLAEVKTDQGLEMADIESRWTIDVTNNTATGYDVSATNKKDANIKVTYNYKSDGTGTGFTP